MATLTLDMLVPFAIGTGVIVAFVLTMNKILKKAK